MLQSHELILKLAAKAKNITRSEDARTYKMEMRDQTNKKNYPVEIRLRVSSCLEVELGIYVDETTWHVNTITKEERVAMFALSDTFRALQSQGYEGRREGVAQFLETI